LPRIRFSILSGLSVEDLTEIGITTGLLRRFVLDVFEELVDEKGLCSSVTV
jgi:hypothetical protein